MSNRRSNSFELYFEFLRFCLQEDARVPSNLNEIDWDELYEFGKKQAILGVLFYGIKKLSDTVYRPNKSQIFKWYSACLFIERANKQTYKDAVALTELLY